MRLWLCKKLILVCRMIMVSAEQEQLVQGKGMFFCFLLFFILFCPLEGQEGAIAR